MGVAQSLVAAVAFGNLHTASCQFTVNTYTPNQFGAVGDGDHIDTYAVRSAAKAAAEAAPDSRLLFPAGFTFLTGPFNISASGVVVEIEKGASIVALASSGDWPQVPPLPWYGGPSDYQESGAPMRQGFIYSDGANDIVLTGEGSIQGNGSLWQDCWHHDKQRAPCLGVGRPHLVQLTRGKNVTISGLTIENSPCWTVHPSMIQGLHIYNLTIRNPASSSNTDGIDVDCVQDAVIEDSFISVGDDALCVKSGINWLGRTYGRESTNITFQRIQIGTGHGISVGSETSAGVNGVVFRDIAMSGTERGGRIKSQRGRGGHVQNIVYENITMDGVGVAFEYTLNYHPGLPPTNVTGTPKLSNVTAKSIRATGAGSAWSIDGLQESIIEGLAFNGVSVGYTGKEGSCELARASCAPVQGGGAGAGGGITDSTATCPKCT